MKESKVEVINRWPPLEVARAGPVLITLGLTFYLPWRVQEVVFLLMVGKPTTAKLSEPRRV